MKKTIALVLTVAALLCCLVGCSSKWTDEDITKAHTVEITKYDGDDYNTKTIYNITDKETVRNLCNTFSIIELTDTRIKGTTKKAYYIRFIGNGGEIDHVTVIQGHNTLQDRHGDLYKITDEMDIERHLNEIIETATSEKDIVS